MAIAAQDAISAEDINLKIRSITKIVLATHSRIPVFVPLAGEAILGDAIVAAAAPEPSRLRMLLFVAKWIVLAAAVMAPWVLLLTS